MKQYKMDFGVIFIILLTNIVVLVGDIFLVTFSLPRLPDGLILLLLILSITTSIICGIITETDEILFDNYIEGDD